MRATLLVEGDCWFMTDLTPEATNRLEPAVTALTDAHEQWHDLVEAYHDPAKFRRTLEALVQTLRNVTFRVQSVKAEFEDFDEWYLPWQDYMKADRHMKWLSDTRTEVTKRKGISPESYALVRYVDSYLIPTTILLKVKASMDSEEVVRRSSLRVDPKYRKHCALEVRRRWVPEGMSIENEASAVCAHVFHVLDCLLNSASEVLRGGPVETPRETLRNVSTWDCMAVSPADIPLLFEADTGNQFDFEMAPIEFDPEDDEKAHKRYARLDHRSLGVSDPFQRARDFHELARGLFRKDKVYYPTVQLMLPDGSWEMVSPMATDKRDKFMMWHAIGSRVLIRSAGALIATNEVWRAPVPKEVGPYFQAEESAERTESLVTMVEDEAGGRLMIESPIFRQLGKPFLRRSVETIPPPEAANYLLPVRRSWELLAEGRKAPTNTDR